MDFSRYSNLDPVEDRSKLFKLWQLFTFFVTPKNNVKCKHSLQSQAKQGIKQFLIFREWMSLRCRDHYSTLFQTVRFFLITINFSHITDILAQKPNLLNVISSSTVLHVQSALQILQTVSLVVPEMSNASVRQIWTKLLLTTQNLLQSSTVDSRLQSFS